VRLPRGLALSSRDLSPSSRGAQRRGDPAPVMARRDPSSRGAQRRGDPAPVMARAEGPWPSRDCHVITFPAMTRGPVITRRPRHHEERSDVVIPPLSWRDGIRHHEERSDVVIPPVMARAEGSWPSRDCFVITFLAMTALPAMTKPPPQRRAIIFFSGKPYILTSGEIES
jgi:hypothetical protein